ncbi:MAG: DUF3859 domain-containing protein [Planctomycetota bacterium]|jgi:hypothetical protein|nr:DUF3859 domain-containing protein [Planctomycetota bacterium]
MAKRHLKATERSYGIYEAFSGKKGAVPQIQQFTDTIPARLGVEFGYVLQINGGHGAELEWRIDHPPFPDHKGKPSPAFTGHYHVRGNDYTFFLGDTVWEPWGNKCGPWTLTTWHEGVILARRCLLLVPPED